MDSIAGLSRQTLGAPPAGGQAGASPMGQDVFLKLLVTQLQHQNPLKPVDNESFIGQLAQFSQLEQTNKLVSLMEQNVAGTQATQSFGLVSLIGRDVQVGGDQVRLGEGPVPVSYTVEGDAASVDITFLDGSGRPVRAIRAGAQEAGERQLLWDGRDQAGRPLAVGLYGVAVSAVDSGGRPVAVTPGIRARVTGLTVEGGRPKVLTGERALDPADIRRIY